MSIAASTLKRFWRPETKPWFCENRLSSFKTQISCLRPMGVVVVDRVLQGFKATSFNYL